MDGLRQGGPPALRLSPRGPLVAGGLAEEVSHLLDRLLREGQTRVVVDLSAVDAIDGAGVQGLLKAHEGARRLGGFLRLASPRPAVRVLLAQANTPPGLEVHDTVEEASARPWLWREIRFILVAVGVSAGLVALGLWWPGLRDGASRRVPGVPPGVALLHASTELLELAAAALIGLVITGAARRVQRDRALNDSMEQAQVLLCVSGAMMMIIIGDSLARAFGVVGAAGVVRFRTPVEDPRDVTILFLLMGLGMACGIGALATAGLGMLFLCTVLLVLHQTLVRPRAEGMLVEVTAGGPRVPTAHVAAAFARHGVVADLVEISPGPQAVVRYRATLPPNLAPGDVETSLVGDGARGVSAVSFLAAGGSGDR